MKKCLRVTCVFTIILILISAKISLSQWTAVGTVTNVAAFPSISVASQNVVWVVGGPAGTPVVWRSTNGGTNFTSIPTTGVLLDLFCVWAVDENTAFVGNGGNAGGTTGGNARFFRTTNAGVSWTEVGATGGTAGFFNGIVFSKTVPTFGIAQSDPPTGSGQAYYVSRTTDGGNTWTVTNPPGFTGNASAQNSIIVIDQQFYGWGSNASPPSLIVTTDGGTTWNKRSASVTGTFTSGIAFKDDKRIGLLASSSSLPNISRTTDGGLTWLTINTGAGVTGYCNLKWVDGTNTCYLSGQTGAAGVVKKSTDAGLTWTQMSTAGLNAITHMEYKRVGTSVYAYAVTANGAVLKLTDIVTEISPANNLIPTEYMLEQNYPNPFNPTTTINFSIPSSSKVTLKVYDALGKEVETLVNEFKQAGNYSADFTAASSLTSGVYFYTITADNFSDTKKLMLVK